MTTKFFDRPVPDEADGRRVDPRTGTVRHRQSDGGRAGPPRARGEVLLQPAHQPGRSSSTSSHGFLLLMVMDGGRRWHQFQILPGHKHLLIGAADIAQKILQEAEEVAAFSPVNFLDYSTAGLRASRGPPAIQVRPPTGSGTTLALISHWFYWIALRVPGAQGAGGADDGRRGAGEFTRLRSYLDHAQSTLLSISDRNSIYIRIRLYHPRDMSSSRLYYWPFSAGTEFDT